MIMPAFEFRMYVVGALVTSFVGLKAALVVLGVLMGLRLLATRVNVKWE